MNFINPKFLCVLFVLVDFLHFCSSSSFSDDKSAWPNKNHRRVIHNLRKARHPRSPRTDPENTVSLLATDPTSSEEERGRKSSNTSSYGKLALPPGYDKLSIPISAAGFSVYVYVSIFVRTILDVDEKNGELVLDADIGMRWVDWKIFEFLKNSSWKDPTTGIPLGNRTLDSEVLKEIWKPDIFIDEMSGVSTTALLAKQVTLNFLADTGSDNKGDIVYSARTTLRLRCDMSFEKYPADTQTCEYYIRSYSYPIKQLRLFWNTARSIYMDDPGNPNFDLQIYSAEPHQHLNKLYIEEKFDEYRVGNYSALLFSIKARRKLSYHIVQTYLPSVLLIFITWLCFLIPSSMVEARIGISMTTVLTLTAMFAAVREQSPEVSYTMAIDIYMVFCIFFVFIALLLFTLIYWMKLRLSKKQEKEEGKKEGNSTEYDDEDGSTAVEAYKRIVDFTKKYAFSGFACIFVIFFVVYWIWLLTSSSYFDWNPSEIYNAASDVSESDDDSTNLYLYHERKIGENSSETSSEERFNTVLQNFDRELANILNGLTNLTDSELSESAENATTLRGAEDDLIVNTTAYPRNITT